MFCLHRIDHEGRVSTGVVEPGTGRVFDLLTLDVIDVADDDVVCLMHQGGAYFAPELVRAQARMPGRVAANPTLVPLTARKPVQNEFVSGYSTYAQRAARYWRDTAPTEQVVLSAGVFALASVQTGINATLRLQALLVPYLVDGVLPNRAKLRAICETAAVGLQNSRPDWFLSFYDYVPQIVARMQEGMRDDELRRDLCLNTVLPLGLSIAKLSFVLALVGNNAGCLDARILSWAYGSAKEGKQASDYMSTKTKAGSVSEERYARYTAAEREILTRTPYFDPEDPVGLARSQWMLWEQLGEGGPEHHDHKEFFDAVKAAL
jgi:hypothetical protein